MARIKPQTLLLRSKKKKGPSRVSVPTINVCCLLVSNEPKGMDSSNFEGVDVSLDSKKYDLPGYPTLNTPKGYIITVELFKDGAPEIVDKFLDLCQKGHSKGMPFHRVIKHYVIQGGNSERLGAAEDWKSKEKLHTKLMTRNKQELLACSMTKPLLSWLSPKHEAFMLGTTKSKQDDKKFGFFITTAPIPDLNNRFISFGLVVKGQDVVKGQIYCI